MTHTDELLQKILDETKILRHDTELERAIIIGPYSLAVYRAANVDPPIALPATIQPQQRLRLLGPIDGPAALLFAACTLSSIDFQFEVERDNEVIFFDGIGSIYSTSDKPFGPGVWMSQVDFANSLFTMYLNSGHPAGLPFYDNVKIHVRNTGTAAIAMVSFLVIVRFVQPLSAFEGAIARDRNQR